MKQSPFTLTFKDMQSDLDHVKVDILPCQFQNSVDECNKDIYFDPII